MASSAQTETQISPPTLCDVLASAVIASGRTRREIGARSAIHKDSLRRILAGQRTPTLDEATAILRASDSPPNVGIILCLIGESERATSWHNEPVAEFLDNFFMELPKALDRVLGNQLSDLRPRWAKGTAHRVARVLSDHIEEIERKEALFGGPLDGRDG